MTPAERQQSLISARRGAQWLSAHVIPLLDIEEMRNNVQCLIDEFRRLDIGEQKRNEAGRRFGKLGKDSATLPPKPGKQRRGRPRKESK